MNNDDQEITITLKRKELVKLCRPPYFPSVASLLHKIREQVKLEMW